MRRRRQLVSHRPWRTLSRKPRTPLMNLTELPPGALLIIILVLTVLSAYFSGSETAMIALNRYRLRHLVKEGHRGARKASRLLERPDRLLGVILIGNNLVNFSAASVATVLGLHRSLLGHRSRNKRRHGRPGCAAVMNPG